MDTDLSASSDFQMTFTVWDQRRRLSEGHSIRFQSEPSEIKGTATFPTGPSHPLATPKNHGHLLLQDFVVYYYPILEKIDQTGTISRLGSKDFAKTSALCGCTIS